MYLLAKRAARFLPALLIAMGGTTASHAQVSALRNNDDQFIQSLREQDMSDLLERFVETEPPDDPIARLALDVALKEFVSEDLLERATVANQQGDVAQAVELFNQSRASFEEVLAAQRQLVTNHKDDERLPIWQTDFAEMLIDRYLPRYFQNVFWVYEYGQPNEEQAQAFSKSMAEALVVTAQANRTLELLINRASADDQLRPKLEELGIWFRLEDYRKINTPYWYAHAAHGVSLLPDSDPYYTGTKQVEVRRPNAADEKKRLRNQVINATSAGLLKDERTQLTAKLLSGRTLVWSDEVDDNDDGVEVYLEPVISEADGTKHAYLAKLSKAIGRWKAGELETALEILDGMSNDNYVKADGTGVSLLLASDLMFKILNVEASKAPEADRKKLVAAAYERAYVGLINNEDPRYRNILFSRWADGVKDDDDPSLLPPTVRMGIGEQLTQQGGALAQIVVGTAAAGAPQIPAEKKKWQDDLLAKHGQATSTLTKAAKFNQTLIGEDAGVEGDILARGLYNLGMNKYWLNELEKITKGPDSTGWQPIFEVAELWLKVAQKAPESQQARQSLEFSLGLLQGMDVAINSPEVRIADIRRTYKDAFDLLHTLWPLSEVCHNNRVYAGFNLYEKLGDLEQAVDIYRGLPSAHKDYFQARRQMIYAMHRSYSKNANDLLLHEAIQPGSPPVGADAKTVQAAEEAKIQWEKRRDKLVETLGRQSGDLIDDAELLIIDASEEEENAQKPERRFTAATAHGAATVVLSGMEADKGETKKSLDLLEGFENTYSPKNGKFAQLATLQQNPEGAKATLRGLIRSAQQQRIVSLLEAEKIADMATQARSMMSDSPDVAASVVAGVLTRVRAQIEVQERIVREAPFKIQKDKAQERIKFLAGASVELTKLLVSWAQGQGFDEKKMVAYRLPLADALMLAGQAKDALDIMIPIEKANPNVFNIAMKTGMAHLAVFKQTKDTKYYNGANKQFRKIIDYYNRQQDKPATYWEAWFQFLRLLDAAGGDQAKEIPGVGRMLKQVDEELGGPAFKDRIMDVIERNGGIERLDPVSN